jgi:uncharacterized protein
MIRGLLILIILFVAYSILKSVFSSLFRTSDSGNQRSNDARGEEMVLDPQCRTYVVRSRAITRRINGSLCSFCSESCAKEYEAKEHR